MKAPSSSNPASASAIVSLQTVTKRFGRRVAVNAVSFEVPAGSIYGLLGHNGAGKSTLIGLLLGQILPDAGTVLIDGFNIHRNRREALARSVLFTRRPFYGHMTGRKNLHILCEYRAHSIRATGRSRSTSRSRLADR